MLSKLAVTAVLAAAPLAAQSLDANVVRNPADTVTYTIDLDGPPRGQAAILYSFALAPAPIQIPGLINPLWLDPTLMFSLGGVTFDPFGAASLSITAPIITTHRLPIAFQSLNLDANFHLAFSTNWCALQHTYLPGQSGGQVFRQCGPNR